MGLTSALLRALDQRHEHAAAHVRAGGLIDRVVARGESTERACEIVRAVDRVDAHDLVSGLDAADRDTADARSSGECDDDVHDELLKEGEPQDEPKASSTYDLDEEVVFPLDNDAGLVQATFQRFHVGTLGRVPAALGTPGVWRDSRRSHFWEGASGRTAPSPNPSSARASAQRAGIWISLPVAQRPHMPEYGSCRRPPCASVPRARSGRPPSCASCRRPWPLARSSCRTSTYHT